MSCTLKHGKDGKFSSVVFFFNHKFKQENKSSRIYICIYAHIWGISVYMYVSVYISLKESII